MKSRIAVSQDRRVSRLANHSTSGGTPASWWNSAAINNRLAGGDFGRELLAHDRGRRMLPGVTPARLWSRR